MMMRVGVLMNGVVPVLVGVALLPGSTEQTSYLMRRQIRNDFHSLLKFIGDAFDVMRLHDT